MTNRSWRIYWLLCACGLLTGLIRWQYASGFALGAAVSWLLWNRNVRFWNGVVDKGESHSGTGLSHFLVNYGLMAAVLLFGAWYPQYANIFACAAGLLLIKLTVTVESLIPSKGGDHAQ